MKAEDVPKSLAETPCADYDFTTAVDGPPLNQRRIALISTAGLMHRNDSAFSLGSVDYRILDTQSSEDILMSHVSTNFDRSGFVQDHNIALPLDRLKEKADKGEIGSVAQYHYSFMGATEPEKMRPAAQALAKNLLADKVDGLVLLPV